MHTHTHTHTHTHNMTHIQRVMSRRIPAGKKHPAVLTMIGQTMHQDLNVPRLKIGTYVILRGGGVNFNWA
jgi:hypothetical protein